MVVSLFLFLFGLFIAADSRLSQPLFSANEVVACSNELATGLSFGLDVVEGLFSDQHQSFSFGGWFRITKDTSGALESKEADKEGKKSLILFQLSNLREEGDKESQYNILQVSLSLNTLEIILEFHGNSTRLSTSFEVSSGGFVIDYQGFIGVFVKGSSAKLFAMPLESSLSWEIIESIEASHTTQLERVSASTILGMLSSNEGFSDGTCVKAFNVALLAGQDTHSIFEMVSMSLGELSLISRIGLGKGKTVPKGESHEYFLVDYQTNELMEIDSSIISNDKLILGSGSIIGLQEFEVKDNKLSVYFSFNLDSGSLPGESTASRLLSVETEEGNLFECFINFERNKENATFSLKAGGFSIEFFSDESSSFDKEGGFFWNIDIICSDSSSCGFFSKVSSAQKEATFKPKTLDLGQMALSKDSNRKIWIALGDSQEYSGVLFNFLIAFKGSRVQERRNSQCEHSGIKTSECFKCQLNAEICFDILQMQCKPQKMTNELETQKTKTNSKLRTLELSETIHEVICPIPIVKSTCVEGVLNEFGVFSDGTSSFLGSCVSTNFACNSVCGEESNFGCYQEKNGAFLSDHPAEIFDSEDICNQICQTPNCIECNSADFSKCLKCKEGFSLFSDQNGSTSCHFCPFPCLKCALNMNSPIKGQSECLQCPLDYFLFQGKCWKLCTGFSLDHDSCIEKCPIGFMERSYGVCEPCSSDCQQCFYDYAKQSSICSQCFDGHGLDSDFKCFPICQEDTSETGHCVKSCESCLENGQLCLFEKTPTIFESCVASETDVLASCTQFLLKNEYSEYFCSLEHPIAHCSAVNMVPFQNENGIYQCQKTEICGATSYTLDDPLHIPEFSCKNTQNCIYDSASQESKCFSDSCLFCQEKGKECFRTSPWIYQCIASSDLTRVCGNGNMLLFEEAAYQCTPSFCIDCTSKGKICLFLKNLSHECVDLDKKHCGLCGSESQCVITVRGVFCAEKLEEKGSERLLAGFSDELESVFLENTSYYCHFCSADEKCVTNSSIVYCMKELNVVVTNTRVNTLQIQFNPGIPQIGMNNYQGLFEVNVTRQDNTSRVIRYTSEITKPFYSSQTNTTLSLITLKFKYISVQVLNDLKAIVSLNLDENDSFLVLYSPLASSNLETSFTLMPLMPESLKFFQSSSDLFSFILTKLNNCLFFLSIFLFVLLLASNSTHVVWLLFYYSQQIYILKFLRIVLQLRTLNILNSVNYFSLDFSFDGLLPSMKNLEDFANDGHYLFDTVIFYARSSFLLDILPHFLFVLTVSLCSLVFFTLNRFEKTRELFGGSLNYFVGTIQPSLPAFLLLYFYLPVTTTAFLVFTRFDFGNLSLVLAFLCALLVFLFIGLGSMVFLVLFFKHNFETLSLDEIQMRYYPFYFGLKTESQYTVTFYVLLLFRSLLMLVLSNTFKNFPYFGLLVSMCLTCLVIFVLKVLGPFRNQTLNFLYIGVEFFFLAFQLLLAIVFFSQIGNPVVGEMAFYIDLSVELIIVGAFLGICFQIKKKLEEKSERDEAMTLTRRLQKETSRSMVLNLSLSQIGKFKITEEETKETEMVEIS